MNKTGLIRNENGSIMVISIVILALLTIIGIAVTTTSSIELQIAGNDKIYKENFYLAEGAGMMLAQILENETAANLKSHKFQNPGQGGNVDIPVKGTANDIDNDDILKDTYWEGSQDRKSVV